MRVIGEISHPECKITLFHWNNRYLIKLENGLLEQTFKIPEYDLASEADLKKVVSDTFVREALHRFEEMQRSLDNATNAV
jgi:hypothetical protein